MTSISRNCSNNSQLTIKNKGDVDMSICPYCGKKLAVRMLEFKGVKIDAGFEPCNCEMAVQRRQKQAEQEARAAAELQERKAKEARLRVGVPRRYLDAKHPQAAKLAQAAMNGDTLFISGDVGAGKTYLACAVCRELQKQNIRFKMYTAVGLLGLFEDAMRQRKSETDLLAKLVQPEVLVIDDLGKERVTNWTYERIFDLLDMRYNDLKPTIITSNFSMSALAARLVDNGCNEDNAKALISRLRQTSKTIPLQGQDKRLVS